MSPADPLPRTDVTLTESQRRHLAVFLELLEEALLDIERAAQGGPGPRRLLLMEVDDLPPRFAASIAPDLRELRERLRALVEHLGLEPRTRSRAGLIRAVAGKCLVDLADAGSRGLRGYGSLDPGIVREIDPMLEAMQEPLVRIVARLSAPDL